MELKNDDYLLLKSKYPNAYFLSGGVEILNTFSNGNHYHLEIHNLIFGTLPAVMTLTKQQGIFMKALIILSLTLVSFNIFAAEVSENKKSDCKDTVQSNKRQAKMIIEEPSEAPKKEVKSALGK